MRADLRAHLHPELRVQVRERLVHQEGLRLADDRPAHRDALALATGQFAWPLVEQFLEVEHRRGLADPPPHLLLPTLWIFRLRAMFCTRSCADRARSSGTPSRRPDRPAAPRSPPGRRSDRAARQVLEPGDHPQHRRLAAPGRSDEDQQLPVRALRSKVWTASVPSANTFETSSSTISAIETISVCRSRRLIPSVPPKRCRRSASSGRRSSTITVGRIVMRLAAIVRFQGVSATRHEVGESDRDRELLSRRRGRATARAGCSSSTGT